MALTLSAGNDRTGVAHTPARGGSTASNETDNGLGLRPGEVVLFKICSSLFFHAATDLADDNNAYGNCEYVTCPDEGSGLTLRSIIFEENLDHIKVSGTREGVTTNTNAKSLTEPHVGGLGNSLVSEGARAGHDT